jgi:hypothetical protein
MKTNYRHQKKLKEQARLTRQAEKLQRRLAKPESTDADATAGGSNDAASAGSAAPSKPGA